MRKHIHVTVLLVCPGWPPVSLCVEHMACCLFGAMCSHVDCLSPPILLLIIVSVAPAVSPSLPSFVSLYSLLVSAVLFWSVVFRVSMSCELNIWLCSSLLPACLFFPFGVVFVLLFNFVIKNPKSLHLSPRPHLSPDRTDQTRWGLSRGGNRQPWVQGVKFSTSTRETRPLRFTPGTSWEWLASRLRRRPASWCFFGEA